MLTVWKENTVEIEKMVHSFHSEELMNWLVGWVRQVICEPAGREAGARGQLVLRSSASDKLSGRAGGGARARRASARARFTSRLYMGLTPACPCLLLRPPRRLPLRPRHWLLRKRYPTDIHDAHTRSAKRTQAQNTLRCHTVFDRRV